MFKKKEEEKVEEEILSIVEEGHDKGYIHENEAEMISNILDFDDKYARDIMTSRNKIFALDKNTKILDALPEALSSNYSRYPVFDEDIDNIVGTVHLKDLVATYLEDPSREVSSVTEDAMLIHPTMLISKLLKAMQRRKIHMAVIIDEYGQTDGLVTLEDVLEEIVGDIQDEHDTPENDVKKAADEGYIVDGQMTLNDLSELLKDVEFPEEDIETVNGFMLYSLGHLPQDSEEIDIKYGGYSFVPLEMKDNMITSVKIKKLPEEESEADENVN